MKIDQIRVFCMIHFQRSIKTDKSSPHLNKFMHRCLHNYFYIENTSCLVIYHQPLHTKMHFNMLKSEFAFNSSKIIRAADFDVNV